jgi:orotate phosphoribosyltransferase
MRPPHHPFADRPLSETPLTQLGTTPSSTTDRLADEFVRFAVESGVLRFGSFVTKAGRQSPYFFNAGLFDDGAKLARLSSFYARALIASGLGFDMLFGPAYKGITLAAGCAMALASEGRNTPFCHDRKEAKDHGEGGVLVGAPLRGRVVIIDDVITDGASKRASVELIRAQGATPAAVLIALDRMERVGPDSALSTRSAVEEFTQTFGVPVVSLATVGHLLRYLSNSHDPALSRHADAVRAYRDRYGVTSTASSPVVT